MRDSNEILIQDISGREKQRFLEDYIYARPEKPPKPEPLYFAPHFSKTEHKGIYYISEILAIAIVENGKIEIGKNLDECTSDKALVKKSLGGIKDITQKRTCYFLGERVSFSFPLVKVSAKKQAGWIGPDIIHNRCVSFLEFLEHIKIPPITR
jgi:hypothetical protein